MFTSMDKAWIAILSGIVFVLNAAFGWDFSLSPEVYSSVASVITGLLVWVMPNKE